MQIALVNPPQPYLVYPGQIEPLGLEYLESAVRSSCPAWRTTLVDLSATPISEAAQVLRGADYDVIAYTSTSLDYATVRGIAEQLSDTGAVQVIGGPHATVTRLKPDHIWAAVFYGEGEETLPEFLNGWPYTLAVYEALGRTHLDEFEWPIRHGSPAVLSVVGSRGCAMRCAFCSAGKLWPGKVRRRGVAGVAQEILQLHKDFPDALISLFDEDLGSDCGWLGKLCERLVGSGTRWKAQMRVDRVAEYLLDLMRLAGCVEVDFGVESFDQRVLNTLNKRTTVQQNFDAVRAAHKAGLPARLYMMIGTPGQTYQVTVRKNIEALEALKGKFAVVCMCPYTPMPGTSVADDPFAYGVTILDKDVSKYHRYAFRREADGEVRQPVWSPIAVEGMTHEELLEDIAQMYAYVRGLAEVNDGRRAVV
jgi:radical SAM superfamily enzyme YgiQ (UPF0313 family)